MIAALLLVACASAQDPVAPAARPGVANLREAERVFALGNPEQSRVLVERAIAEMLRGISEATDDDDDRALRDAGALAYKLRSLEPARRAWDAVRRYRERTLEPDSREVQNARGNVSWIGEQMGLVAEARMLEEQILAALTNTATADDEALLFARSNLADTLLQQDVEHGRALELMGQVAEARRAQFPAGHKKRLRAELDLACGLVGVGQLDDADAAVARVLAECPADATEIRVRAASDLVWIRAARGDRGPFSTAAWALANEVDTVDQEIAHLDWRAAEVRAAELRPFADLVISAALGLGLFPVDEALAQQSALRSARVAGGAPNAVFHRFERSRLEQQAQSERRRVLVDERMLVAVVEGAQGSWLDLGSMESVRALVQAWSDAAEKGPALREETRIAEALFGLVVRALGDPERLRIVPDEVLWAVPLTSIHPLNEIGREIGIEVVLEAARDRESRPLPTGAWTVFGAPAKTSAKARATNPAVGGTAAAFLESEPPPSSRSTDEFGWRTSVEVVRGEEASLARFRELAVARPGIVLTTSSCGDRPAAPCLTTPRAIEPATTIASAMAREDVVGGSSPADLCGIPFAGYCDPVGADARVRAAPRAADFRGAPFAGRCTLVCAGIATSADCVRRARDIEAFARAFVAAGFTEVCLAVRPLVDAERVRLPGDLDAQLPRAERTEGERIPGPWLRVRAAD
jgi:hypothetical protein